MNKPGLTLEETFDIYVKAVQNSDLEALFTTVSKSDDFYSVSYTHLTLPTSDLV